MSRGDGRALRAARDAIYTFVASDDIDDVPLMARATYDAILDALLSELPEEAVEALGAIISETAGMPYMARSRDYVSEGSTGDEREREKAALREADAEADRKNRAFVEELARAFLLSLRSPSRA